MIKIISRKLVKLLGGVTKDEHDEFKKSCELFARNYLVSRYKLTCFGNGSLKGGEVNAPMVVVGSCVMLDGVNLQGLYVAPWAFNVAAKNILIENRELPTGRRAFIESQLDDGCIIGHG